MRATALLLILASCRSPPMSGRRTEPTLAIRFEPTGDLIYKIDDDLGHEGWDFALIVRGELADVDRVRIEHRRGDVAVHAVEYAIAALAPYRAQEPKGELAWRYLNFRLPTALDVDSVEAALLAGERVRGRARARLVRFHHAQRFRLPLRGCWFVSSGHDFGVEHRRHYSRGHFAWDFVRADAHGRSGTGDRL